MMTKKILSAILVVVLTFATLACSSCGNNNAGEPNGSNNGGTPVIRMSPGNAAPSPGDEFNITVSVKNGELFCYTDLYMTYDDTLVEYISYEGADIDGLYADINSSTAGKLYYAAYVATTENITSDNLIVLTFKVLDNVQTGGSCSFSFEERSKYAVGEDAQGNNVLNITDKVTFEGCSITVA